MAHAFGYLKRSIRLLDTFVNGAAVDVRARMSAELVGVRSNEPFSSLSSRGAKRRGDPSGVVRGLPQSANLFRNDKLEFICRKFGSLLRQQRALPGINTSEVERLDPKPLNVRAAGLKRVAVNSLHLLASPRFIAAATFWFALSSTAHAQSPAAIQSVRFVVFSAQPIKDAAFVPRPNAAPLKLAFQPTARSVRYEYRGPMPVRFVDPEGGAVVAEANIPAGIQNALLLFSPLDQAKSGTSNLRYQIAVLDDGAGRHGPGGLAIINLSGLALSGKVNNQAVTLKPGLNPTLAVGRTATIKLTTVFKQRTYQSYAGTATLGRNERALLILFPPFYPGALEVQSRLLVDQPPGTPTTAGAKSR